MIKKIFALIFTIVFLVSFASALGITPGRKIIHYEPGLEKEYSFSVINSNGEAMALSFEVVGELAEFIEFDYKDYNMKAGEHSKEFKYKIKLPEQEIFYPGTHTAQIVAREGTMSSDSNIGVRMGVATQIDLEIPYPDKYLEVYPRIISEYEDGPVDFLVGVKNKGRVNIGNAKSYVEIFGENGKLISSFETSESPVASGERIELSGEWKDRVRMGNYKSVITTVYDGIEVIVEKEFSVGTIFLEIEKITARNFKLGEIAKLDVLVRNKLDADVENCYIKINVYSDGKEIGQIASAPYNLGPLTTTNLVAYWDTQGVETGEYEGQLILGYSDGRFEEDVIVKVLEDDIIIVGLGEMEKIKKKMQIDFVTLVNFVLIIIILAISIALFKKLRKKYKKYKK